jgi:hypothetical protein
VNELSLIVLMAVAGALILRGLLLKTGPLRYPFLAALVVAGWFIPQAIGLTHDVLLPEGGYALTMFYASACLVAVFLGDVLAKRPASVAVVAYDERRLLIGAAVLSAVGLLAYSMIFRVDREVNEQGLTTGIVTILFFFSRLQYFGYGIALLLLLNRWSWPALAIVLIDLNSILGFVLFGGRRGPAVDIILITLCMLWFQRRILVPRLALIGGAAVAAIVVNSIGQYRSLVATNERLPTLEEFFTIDFLETFTQITQEGFFEVRNAITYIAATFETGNYNFGMGYWNSLVFSYIPAQFVGADLKAALMFDLPDNAAEAYGYQGNPGATFTGFADSFIALSFLGVFVWGWIAAIFARWWHRANAGDWRAQLFYALSLATGLHAVTHGTEWFIAFLPQLFIFTMPLFAWAWVKKEPQRLHTGQVAGGQKLDRELRPAGPAKARP